jgi:uncharacterized membrane protein YfcA
MQWVRAHRPHPPSEGVEDGPPDPARRPPPANAIAYQFLVAVYGGYFGAGIGILMLAALGFMGFTNIHRMNGLKNWGGLCINFMAAVTFAFSGLVDWPVALAMAIGAAVGGYGGSRLAQRVRQGRCDKHHPDRVRQWYLASSVAAGDQHGQAVRHRVPGDRLKSRLWMSRQ